MPPSTGATTATRSHKAFPNLRAKIQADVRQRYQHPDREVFITSGTSGGLLLALCCTVNPGDEVIVFDPYFVMYPHLVTLAGGTTVYVDTYPDFQHRPGQGAPGSSRRAPRQFSSTARRTRPGVVLRRDTLRGLARLALERESSCSATRSIVLSATMSRSASPAEFNENVLVFDGFSKAYGMTGWRLGFAHGPRRIIEEMIKLQQFSFVCAPSIVQHAGVAAWDYDVPAIVAKYRCKRDRIYAGLKDQFELAKPGGAFYAFVKAPWGTGSEFVAEAIRNQLLIIPGNVFSSRDTHFRFSYAANGQDH